MSAICGTALACMYSFQPLVASILAGGAALVTAGVVWRSAHLTDRREREVRQEERIQKKVFMAAKLSAELVALSSRTRSVEGSIRVRKAAQKPVSERAAQEMQLALSEIATDWDWLSLLPVGLQQQLFSFQRQLERHNGYVAEGTTFNEENFQRAVLDNLRLIARQAGHLSSLFVILAKDPDSDPSRGHALPALQP